jgi:polysaccharide export outer membrane protein
MISLLDVLGQWELTAVCAVCLLIQPCFGQSPNSSPGDPPSDRVVPVTVAKSFPNYEKYLIGADDVLAIDVWHEKELSRVVPVRPDGKISLPLLGDLQASGLTPVQLQASIAGRLDTYVGHPEVTVIVQEARSQRFNVVGEVQKAGSYVLGQPLTVLDALALAGGFRDFAKSKKIYVLRLRLDGSQNRIPFNYKELIKGKNIAQNVLLQPGDTVVVP